MYPVLKTKRTKLQVGYCGADESDDKVVVLEKPENTEGCESGFLPLPRAGADNGKNLFHIDGRAMPRSQMPVGAADEKGNIK